MMSSPHIWEFLIADTFLFVWLSPCVLLSPSCFPETAGFLRQRAPGLRREEHRAGGHSFVFRSGVA